MLLDALNVANFYRNQHRYCVFFVTLQTSD